MFCSCGPVQYFTVYIIYLIIYSHPHFIKPKPWFCSWKTKAKTITRSLDSRSYTLSLAHLYPDLIFHISLPWLVPYSICAFLCPLLFRPRRRGTSQGRVEPVIFTYPPSILMVSNANHFLPRPSPWLFRSGTCGLRQGQVHVLRHWICPKPRWFSPWSAKWTLRNRSVYISFSPSYIY